MKCWILVEFKVLHRD